MMIAVDLGPQQIGRLQWCLARSGWNHAGWRRIVFSDESRSQLYSDDHRRRVWRHPGQRVDPAFTIECHTGPQPDVRVWGTISFDSRTLLVVIRRNLQDSGTWNSPYESTARIRLQAKPFHVEKYPTSPG
ncbi:transposable element Tc1 transposase [Trichonephila clavipes]|nr:transposable element Tc1 transposase [Trichonephila clavipes]